MWFNFFSEIPQAYREHLYNIVTGIVQVTIQSSKSMDSAQPIYKYLMKQNSQVVDLITHGRVLYSLRNQIKPLINQYVTVKWQIGEFSKEEITLIVDSAESAHRLRYQAAYLLDDIRRLECFKLLKAIKIKVRPVVAEKTSSKMPQNKYALIYSSTGQQQLKLLADTVEDPALKASLMRLAGHIYIPDEG